MTNLMNQKVGGSKAACPAKCGAQSYHKKKLRAKHPELTIVMIFLKSFTSGIPCMESKASTA